MFDAVQDAVGDHVHRYAINREGAPLSYAEVLGLWQREEVFRSFFMSLLSDSPFRAYRWETPPITAATAARDFEFVLVDAPGLELTVDQRPFRKHFAEHDADEGVVVFDNLGGDALLVVPSPRAPDIAYGHLAAFMRGAPERQRHALWRMVGSAVQRALTDTPLWVSTAGGGVAWLHVRLDTRPKYYAHAAYKEQGGRRD